MEQVQAVIFDLDNTLLWDEKSIQEAFEDVCGRAAESTGVDPAALEHEVRAASERLFRQLPCYDYAKMIELTNLETLWGRFDSGGHPALLELRQLAPLYQNQAWTEGLLKLGIDDPALGKMLAARFAVQRRERPLVYEDTFEVLQALRPRYRLLLLTNGAPDLQQEKVDSIPGLAGYFDHVVISGTFGRGKPDPAIFEHALELLGLSAEEAVMVGDNLDTDISGALAAGIRSVWINHHQRMAPEHKRPAYEIRKLKELLDLLHK
ncbi:HAD family hydrolase [Paenibacillus sp. GCM10023248]|uniref:HAD family hydrolase n=1 Tax=Bacillales TaxID=1385 RepID=UPI0023794C78|nr:MULTISPECIES: HAD family hydrolase [Bacillales]MDD9265890.1 HAD family hydrolase [Paenibacillus sp. MAHUQ-63]MDR6879129.1 putative hydrolase of the HAD superfamily [Bacillus sp. 3255]